MTQTSEQAAQNQEDRSVRIMRSVVINMGILLVIGTIALFVAVIIKANSSDEKSESKANAEQNFSADECYGYKQDDIPLMGKVISSDNRNGVLTITTTDQVIAYNLCTGNVIAKFQSVGNN